MSADKRKTILIGFAGLAVVLIAVIAFVRPSFRSEETTGAIGAVQKHHQPQITKADVVLGDEQLKKDEKVLFADYLADANSLKSFSWGNFAQSRGQIQARIDNQQANVQARYYDTFDAAVLGLRALADTETLSAGAKASLLADIDGLSLSAKTRALGDSDLASVASRVTQVANRMNVRSVEAKSLAMADLANAEQALELMQRWNLFSQIQYQSAYLGRMAQESKMLAGARADVMNARLQNGDALALNFARFASELQAAATLNMQSQLKSDEASLAVLGDIADLCNRSQADARAQSMSLAVRDEATAMRVRLDAMSSVAQKSTLYASMLGDSDSFGMQVRTLGSEVNSLDSKLRIAPIHNAPNGHPGRSRAVRRY